VVGPGQKEEVLAYVEKQYPKSSHARACRLLSQTRSKKYHQSKMKEKEKPIVEAIKEATAHRRYGRFLPCPTFAMPISLSQDLQSETFLVPLSVALHSGESESIFYDNGYRIQTRNSGKGKVPWGIHNRRVLGCLAGPQATVNLHTSMTSILNRYLVQYCTRAYGNPVRGDQSAVRQIH
jgi:hypothetical protein